MNADGLESRPWGGPWTPAVGRPRSGQHRGVSPPPLAPFLKCLMDDFSLILELYIDSVVVTY